MRTLLFDADVLGYKFAYAAEETFDFGDGPLVALDPDQAKRRSAEYVEEIVEECGADYVRLCWSDPAPGANFRYRVLPDYKHNRRPEKPQLYWVVRNYLNDRFPSSCLPTLEADDTMGILQTQATSIETIIVSIDKDMLQIPGRHYNMGTGKRQKVDAIDGNHLHMIQTLMGDHVDGYDGIYGTGKVAAHKILEPAGKDPHCMWECVIRAYTLSGQFARPDHAALQQARVAKILQTEDYNAKTRRPRLWRPPT